MNNRKIIKVNAIGQQLRYTPLFGGYYQIVASAEHEHRPLHGGKRDYIFQLWAKRYESKTACNQIGR